MPCGRPPRGRDAASQSWSATQSAKSCSNQGPRVRSLSGTASQSVRPSNTIASTMSPDAARGGGVRRQRGVDCACTVTRSATCPGARTMGAVARSGREASHLRSRFHRDISHFLDRNANRDVALKTTAGVAQVKVRGLAKVQAVFSFAILAYNLVLIPKLLEAT
jgi:hypothetical protein